MDCPRRGRLRMGVLAGAPALRAHAAPARGAWGDTGSDGNRLGGLGPTGRRGVVRLRDGATAAVRGDADVVLHTTARGACAAPHESAGQPGRLRRLLWGRGRAVHLK